MGMKADSGSAESYRRVLSTPTPAQFVKNSIQAGARNKKTSSNGYGFKCSGLDNNWCEKSSKAAEHAHHFHIDYPVFSSLKLIKSSRTPETDFGQR